MIPGAIGIVANIIAAYAVQNTKRKSPIILGILVFPIAGAAGLYAIPREARYNNALLAVYFILQIFQPITPVIFSWTFANTAGHTKKTTTTGALYIGLCLGNIVGPQLYLPAERPYYPTVSH
jgi:predicted MFS family arabinose efflux permease